MPPAYSKDFDNWNTKKKSVDATEISRDFFFHEREIWWCSIGVNVGSEMDGKNEYFERPVLVVRKINKEQFFGVPLTSQNKSGKYYVPISLSEREGTICLSQFKTFSSKRLLRKMDTLNKEDFAEVKLRFVNFFTFAEQINESDPRASLGSSEAEATNTLIVQNSGENAS